MSTKRTTPGSNDAYCALLRAQALARVLRMALIHEGNACPAFVEALDAILEQLEGPILFCDAGGAE